MNRNNGRLYQLNHCTYMCNYHIVWVTAYRRKYFEKEWNKRELRNMVRSICRWKGFEIRAWHVGDEHVHLYISIPPKYSVSYAVNILKGKSSSWIKKKTKRIEGSVWQRGYFVSTLGINEIVVKKYIESHGKREKDIQISMDLRKAGG